MKSGCEKPKLKEKRSIKLPVLQNSEVEKNEISKSQTSRWRAFVLIAINLLIIAHIVQWLISGTTVSPIEPSETMFTFQRGAVNAGFIFFSLAILATLIFGRFVCGWGCHILALQDFCTWLLEKFGLKPKPFRSRLLAFIPLIFALYMFVYPLAIRFFFTPKNEPIFPQFTNQIITNDFWATFPPIWIAIPFLFVCGFLTVYFLGSKGFCTYACPYGGFFNLADKVAVGKIRVTDACNQCGHCTATCTSNVLVHKEVKEYGMVVDSGCMKCLDCVSVCPNEALYFGFGKPSLTTKKTIKKNYSLTWTEEIFAAVVFILSLFAVWDVYQLIPMLMALGIAVITTFLVLRIWKLFRANDLSFYRFNLKADGKIKNAGWIFLALALSWIGLNAHSGFIRYHETRGMSLSQNLKIPDELALSQVNPARWISQNDRQNINEAKKHLQTAKNFGLLTNSETLPKLAWLEYLTGNTEQAVSLLEESAEHQSGQKKALSLYYRGAILNRLGRYDEALKNLDESLQERSDLILASEEKGESLWLLGRKDEAISVWNESLKSGANLPLTNYFLAGANANLGKTDEADNFEKQANQTIPDDPLFHWILGLRLQNLKFNELAEKHFQRAIQLNPEFNKARIK
jgi:tetratricopeptide (TPR) repeat protein/NAD-dependent dihydropyrimidine dehydrogenase PreA subunit